MLNQNILTSSRPAGSISCRFGSFDALIIRLHNSILLSEVSIAKNQLQLAGVSAIYIASKVVECLPLNVDTCVMYTDYSVTKVCACYIAIVILTQKNTAGSTD